MAGLEYDERARMAAIDRRRAGVPEPPTGRESTRVAAARETARAAAQQSADAALDELRALADAVPDAPDEELHDLRQRWHVLIDRYRSARYHAGHHRNAIGRRGGQLEPDPDEPPMPGRLGL